ncbi:MAG: hypothetical protein M3290_00990 [Actinomycetota bacterium]|nr:hypothetical protein [Actinomycetota bacterium]
MTKFLRSPIALATALVVAFPLAAVATTRHRGSGNAVVRFQTTVLPNGGGEPNVSISPDGKVVLADGLGGSPASLWRSTDGGKTFDSIQPQFAHTGGGDWDMHWIDNKTIVAADLSLNNGIYIHRSTDAGLKWTTTQIHEDVYDRPWLAVAGKTVYVVAKGFDAVPYCYISNDGGKTFSQTPIPLYGTGVVPAEAGGTSPTATEALVTNQNAYVDHAMTDPKTGDLWVLYGIDSPESYSQRNPTGVPNRLYVAHLEDGPAGQQFVSYPVYLGGAGDSFVDGFNWLTIDRNGTLYVLANGGHAKHESTWLTYSTDHGKHWTKLTDVGEAGATNVYGSIAAGAPGTLAMAYIRGSNSDPSTNQAWYPEFARITHANTDHPSVQRTRITQEPIHTKDICFSGILCGVPGFGNNRDLLDYIWDAIAPDGTAFAVYASDGPATGTSSGVNVLLVRQVAGPKFGTGTPS